MSALLVSAVAWSAALLLVWPPPRRQYRRPRRRRAEEQRRVLEPTRLARPAAGVLAAALVVVAHPLLGLAAGAVLWWLLPAVVARLDSQEDVRRRAALEQQLPMAVGLMAACLAVGAPMPRALHVVAESMADPTRALLSRAARTVELGGDPTDVAAVLAAPGSAGWEAVGAAVVRSADSGAPLAELLHDQADRAAGAWFAQASIRARSAAVASVLPLAACFLPAFLLLGVVPLVAGLFGGVTLP